MKKRFVWLLLYILTIGGTILLVHYGSQAVTAMAENIPVHRAHCIVIDAGHGGEDGGAVSCTGKMESNYNLEIALRMNDILNFMGYETKMIRVTDVSVYQKGETLAQKKASDLKERVRIVRETPAAVLVSIHQNQFPDGRYHGAQVFYADTPGSKMLATQLQTALVEHLNPGSRRKAKLSSGVYLMEHIPCTGILIECGFLSNFEEEAKLAAPAYQKKLCSVIAASLDQFFVSA